MISLMDFLNKEMGKRITNIALADKSGISSKQISAIRTGRNNASFYTAVQLINGLGYKILIKKAGK